MTVGELVGQIQLETSDPINKVAIKDRLRILGALSEEIDAIFGRCDWDWGQKWLEPVVKTSTGVRDYGLPPDFGENFKRREASWNYGYDPGFVCMLDDGSTDSAIVYVNPERFFGLDRTGSSNSRPSRYTIMRTDGDKRRIHLDPAPDANGDTGFYTVNGLYKPTRWSFKTENDPVPFGGPADALKYGAMARLWLGVDENKRQIYELKANQAYIEMARRERREKPAGFRPRFGRQHSWRHRSNY